MRSASFHGASAWPPATISTPSRSSARASDARASRGLASLATTRAPRRRHNRAAATPLAPRPTTSTRLPAIAVTCRWSSQRNFKLERLKSAKRMEMIQNRTMIFGSGHPIFSKW
jgi:hypothetical protein